MSAPPENSIHSALARLEQRAQSSASGWRLLMYAIICIPLALVACAVMGFGIDATQLYIAIGLSGFLALSAGWYGISLTRGLRRRLSVSRLAVAIATGELPPEPLQRALPWIWRGTVPGGVGLSGTLRRIAGNLDWYLSSEERRRNGLASRRLFRASWLIIPLCVLLSLGVLFPTLQVVWNFHSIPVANWLSAVQALSTLRGWRLAYLLLGPLLPLLPLPFIYYRRQVWTEELARYLRSHLDPEPEDSEAV